MALFKSNPEKTLVRDIAAATAARDAITARLADAEGAVAELRMKAERLALDGAADDVLDAAEAKTRTFADRMVTLRAALTQGEAHLADLERERADQADKKLRAETAAEIAELATGLEEVAKEFDSVVTRMAEITRRASAVTFEANGLLNYAAASRMQIPDAVALVAALLRGHAACVLDGSAPATLCAPDVAAPLLEEPKPLTQVFSLNAIQFTDHHGALRRVGKWHDVELPQEAAERALRLGICVPMSDPRRKKLVGQSPGHPEPHWCKNLDAEPEPAAVAEPGQPEPETIFERVDRGPGFRLQIATNV
jgi:hypothetical protein